VAKGRDLIALNIRIIAEKHHLPILEQPALARALYRYAELETGIPALLYSAVAEVLAYVYQLRAYESGEGHLPAIPQIVEVPAEVFVPEGESAPEETLFHTAGREVVWRGAKA
jgi:flagellar biosynthetic protein FlhB